MALVPYYEFIKIPVVFYKTMGQDVLDPDPTQRFQTRLLRILFFINILNYNVQWGLEIVTFIIAIKSNSMTEVTAVAPVIGFAFVGNFKQMTLHFNKLAVRRLLKEMENIYPMTTELQNNYHLRNYIKTFKPLMMFFAGLCIFNTAYFGLYPFFQSIHSMIFLGSKLDFPLAFPMWYPYDPESSWFLYILTHFLQIWAAIVTAIGVLTADLFLVTLVNQLCMHFDYISQSLREYKPTSNEANLEFLRGIVIHHMKCLELSDSVDMVFSFSLLLNFFSSSGTLCFVGFQVISGSTQEAGRYFVLLVTTLAQVWMICVYGNKLMDASLAIGEAAFGQPWYDCDLCYQKMLLLLICRSQKSAAIHAPTFPPISLETFMKVISMSYQFFAVLQSTYDN